MRTKGVLSAAVTGAGCALLLAGVAQAQQGTNPNMGHFYMARQQITITDEAPMVNDQRTMPGAPAAGGGQGALMNRPIPLPKAGWVPYSASVPGLSTSLPKVNNGVPPKAPPVDPNAMRARAGKLKPAKASSPKPPQGPVAVRSYTPYKGYGAPAAVPAPAQVGGSGNMSMDSSTNVRGSVLHWARKKRSAF